MKITSEGFAVETKITRRHMFEDLDERLIEEVVKRFGGVRAFYSTDQVATVMKGIVKSHFVHWIEKEERSKDFNPSILEKYGGKGDQMTYLLHFKQRMSMERIS